MLFPDPDNYVPVGVPLELVAQPVEGQRET